MQTVIDIERKNCEVSNCLFLTKRKTVTVYIIIDLGLFPRTTKLMHELVVKLFVLMGSRH